MGSGAQGCRELGTTEAAGRTEPSDGVGRAAPGLTQVSAQNPLTREVIGLRLIENPQVTAYLTVRDWMLLL